MKTFVEQLTSELNSIKKTMFDLLYNSRISIRRDDSNSNIIILAPTQYWDKPTENEQILQIKLKMAYGRWIEAFKLFTENSPKSSKNEIEQIDKFIANWIEKIVTGEYQIQYFGMFSD